MSVTATAKINLLKSYSASITDALTKADYDCYVAEYEQALPALESSTSSNIQNYSISGRSIAYRSLTEFRRDVESLYEKIKAILLTFGLISGALHERGGYVDNRLDSDPSIVRAI